MQVVVLAKRGMVISRHAPGPHLPVTLSDYFRNAVMSNAVPVCIVQMDYPQHQHFPECNDVVTKAR
jgi:hypothetical protein